MVTTKLIQVLKTFSNIEMKHLGLMTISPYFNRKQEVAELFVLISKHHPKFETDEIEREVVYGKLFPNEKYNDQKFRDLLKSLAKLADEILIKSQRADVDENSLNLVRAYFERGQLELGFRTCERFLKSISASKNRDKNHFHLKTSLTELRNWLRFRMMDGYGMEMAKEAMVVEVEAVSQKSTGFILDVHDSYHIMKSASSVFGFDFDERFFEKTFQPFLDKQETLPIEARMCLSLFAMNNNETLEEYNAANNLLLNEHNQLPDELIEMTLLNLRNFCQGRINEGLDSFLPKLFQLFEWEAQQGLIADSIDGKIRSQHFVSAVAIGLKVGKLSWVDNLIKEYENKLTGKNAQDVAFFCKAMQAFSHGKFKDCRSILSKLDYGTYNQKLLMRLLELRLYYELWDEDLLESKIDSTRHFLSDTEFIPDYRMPMYLNFIRFLQQLVFMRTSNKKISVCELEKEISACLQVEHKDWLLIKCEQMAEL